ncbi:DUF3617 domain-containing protein [Acidobacterium sp. S8]|uniref:DUF3617 domain-containing protein n=1 Tax=Acidobacterium sp. S8 TaxID=1641854 RepID=UPI0021107319|nr:DUF3617 domain-containing protein [Acidobacterium sp. S8]
MLAERSRHSPRQTFPFKTGLWESNVTSSISGIQIPPDVQAHLAQMPPEQQEKIRSMMGGAPQTSVMRSCMTKEQFDKWNDSFHENKDKDEQCTHTNVITDVHERTFDINCTSPTAKSAGRIQMFIDSDEKGHGSVHMVRTASEGPQAMKPITVDVKFDTHYIGSDCGSIKPGDAEPVR